MSAAKANFRLGIATCKLVLSFIVLFQFSSLVYAADSCKESYIYAEEDAELSSIIGKAAPISSSGGHWIIFKQGSDAKQSNDEGLTKKSEQKCEDVKILNVDTKKVISLGIEFCKSAIFDFTESADGKILSFKSSRSSATSQDTSPNKVQFNILDLNKKEGSPLESVVLKYANGDEDAEVHSIPMSVGPDQIQFKSNNGSLNYYERKTGKLLRSCKWSFPVSTTGEEIGACEENGSFKLFSPAGMELGKSEHDTTDFSSDHKYRLSYDLSANRSQAILFETDLATRTRREVGTLVIKSPGLGKDDKIDARYSHDGKEIYVSVPGEKSYRFTLKDGSTRSFASVPLPKEVQTNTSTTGNVRSPYRIAVQLDNKKAFIQSPDGKVSPLRIPSSAVTGVQFYSDGKTVSFDHDFDTGFQFFVDFETQSASKSLFSVDQATVLGSTPKYIYQAARPRPGKSSLMFNSDNFKSIERSFVKQTLASDEETSYDTFKETKRYSSVPSIKKLNSVCAKSTTPAKLNFATKDFVCAKIEAIEDSLPLLGELSKVQIKLLCESDSFDEAAWDALTPIPTPDPLSAKQALIYLMRFSKSDPKAFDLKKHLPLFIQLATRPELVEGQSELFGHALAAIAHRTPRLYFHLIESIDSLSKATALKPSVCRPKKEKLDVLRAVSFSEYEIPEAPKLMSLLQPIQGVLSESQKDELVKEGVNQAPSDSEDQGLGRGPEIDEAWRMIPAAERKKYLKRFLEKH